LRPCGAHVVFQDSYADSADECCTAVRCMQSGPVALHKERDIEIAKRTIDRKVPFRFERAEQRLDGERNLRLIISTSFSVSEAYDIPQDDMRTVMHP
jgi:Fe-S oxidoreductase